MQKILIVDDDRNICRVLAALLEEAGLQAVAVYDAETAQKNIEKTEPGLVITDLKMPGKTGMDLLSYCQKKIPSVPVIMITAHADIETAVGAMKKGAYDFITKPFDEAELLAIVKKALSESSQNRKLISGYFAGETGFRAEIIGNSSALGRVLEDVRKVARTDATVLVTGETGVGKELVARAIHLLSARKTGALIKVNCATIPENLVESEFFGHERGAFTGAASAKPGRFELANRGTLFLDEIGELPLNMQAKLLGAIEDKKFERVGGVKTIKVDVRIIAATNRELEQEIKTGSFRADLFYRLNVMRIKIPPLRERIEDIPPLADYFLEVFSRKHGRPAAILSPEVLEAFRRYDWPGNIRELENVLERMFILSEGETLTAGFLPPVFQAASVTGSGAGKSLNDAARNAERKAILDALQSTGGNRTHAAKMLGISRRTLQLKIKEYSL